MLTYVSCDGSGRYVRIETENARDARATSSTYIHPTADLVRESVRSLLFPRRPLAIFSAQRLLVGNGQIMEEFEIAFLRSRDNGQA